MLRHLAAYRRTLHAVPLTLGGVTRTTDESSPGYKLRLHGAHRRLRTIPKLREQDCAHSTVQAAGIQLTMSVAQCKHEAAAMVVLTAPLATLAGVAEVATEPKRLLGTVPAVGRACPNHAKPQQGATWYHQGGWLLRRVRESGRHDGGNSDRWSGHTRDRKRQRPALNAGARPRALRKDGNRAAPNIWQETQSQRKSGRSSATNGDNGPMDTELITGSQLV